MCDERASTLHSDLDAGHTTADLIAEHADVGPTLVLLEVCDSQHRGAAAGVQYDRGPVVLRERYCIPHPGDVGSGDGIVGAGECQGLVQGGEVGGGDESVHIGSI